jgi:hypothetical protein
VLLVAGGALVACGARSSTIADDEVADCAVERQRVFEECEKRCGVAQSPMRRAGRTSGRAPNDPVVAETPPTPCISECIAAVQRDCEATATCRCADSLLTVAGK